MIKTICNIIDTFSMSAILLDNEFKILHLNASALEVTNLSFSDAKGIDCSIYFPDINFCLANKSKSVETRYIDSNGKTFDIVLKYEEVLSDLCSGLLYITSIPKTAINQSNYSQIRLNIYKERLHFFETFLNHSNQGIQVFNNQGLLIYLNKSETARLGIKLRQHTQYYIWEIESYFENELHWKNVLTELKANNNYSFLSKSNHGNAINLSVNIQYRKINNEEYFVLTNTEVSDYFLQKHVVEENADQVVLFNKNIPAVVYQFVVDKSKQGYFTYVNESFEKMFGFQLPLFEKNWISCLEFDLSYLEPFLNSLNNVIKQKEEYNYTWKLMLPSGEKKWFQVNALPTILEDKLIYSGIILDITERKELEAENNKKQKFNETILDNIPADIAVFDQHHNYLYVNSTGIKNEDIRKWLIGKNDFDYCDFRGVDTTMAKSRRKLFEEAMRTQKQVEWIDEYHKDGKDSYVMRRFSPFIIDGEFKYMIGYGIDISELKNTQNIVIKNQQRNDLILQSSFDAVVKFNANGAITFWNPKAALYFGWSSENVLGKRVYDVIFPKSTRNFHAEDVEEYLMTGKGYTFNKLLELSGINKHKGEFPIEITILPLTETNEEVTFCAFIRDITSRKSKELEILKANQLLKNQNTELEQFTYITSHDLQEPLLTLISLSELLLEEYTEVLDEEGKLFVEFINKSANRMRALIAGLMEYARIDKREALEEIDCNELLKIVLVDLDDRIKRNAAVVTIETLPVLKAYPTYLRLLFQNLISNAIKFKKANGTPEIVISGIERDKDWEFTVSDNGIGIAKKNIEQIFTIFKRLNNQEEYEGYGIGLAHCKKIVSLHGGDIWVDSVLEEGSRFNFTITKKV